MVVAAARGPIHRSHHVERERRLHRRHFPEVALRLLQRLVEGTITLLGDIGEQVAIVGVGEDLAGQNLRHFVARAANGALRSLQRDQGLAGDKPRESVAPARGVHAGVPVTQFAKARAVAGDICESLGPPLCKPATSQFAGLRDEPVEKILQRAAAAFVRWGQPGDTQRLQPGSVILLLQPAQ